MNSQTSSTIQLFPIGLILTSIGVTLFIARSIGLGNTSQLIWYGLVAILGVVAIIFAGDWRRGIYLFLVWLLFEDLIRKYLGNNLVIYLAKDALVAVAYAVFLFKWRQGEVKLFQPPFLAPMLLVIWLGIIQTFNPISPSIFYGIVGLKLYFFYIPLMFVSYALIDSERTLQMFLVFNLVLTSIVATVGIIQSVVGPDFFNPQNLAPELEALNRLFRKAPEEAVSFYRPPGVFLSSGRLAWYLTLMIVVSFGTIIYFALARTSWRLLFIPNLSLSLCALALTMSGSRASFAMTLIGFVCVLLPGTLWGLMHYRRSKEHLVQNLGITSGIVFVGIVVIILLYPTEINARWQFYVQTMIPGSEHSEIEYRTTEFPFRQFMTNVSAPFAPIGYGTGNASQALVYVPDLFGVPLPDTPRAGESGFGVIAIEFGYLGLFLWLVWIVTLLYTGWLVVYRLRETALFFLGFALLWVTVLVLVVMTFLGIMAYQNFVNNAYLWILVGVLFKLPTLANSQEHVEAKSLSE